MQSVASSHGSLSDLLRACERFESPSAGSVFVPTPFLSQQPQEELKMLLLVLAARSSHLFFLELLTSFAAQKVWSCSARALLVGA